MSDFLPQLGMYGYFLLMVASGGFVWISAVKIWWNLNPDSRLSGIGAGVVFGFFAFSAFLMLLVSLGDGEVACGRGCRGTVLDINKQPLGFWIQCLVFYAGGLIFLAGAARGLYSVVANWRRLPYRSRK